MYLVIFFRQFQICIGINALHLCLTTSFLPAQDFASVTRRVSDEERSVRTGTRVSEERAATQSMAQKTSRSKAEVCKTPVPQFKSGCRLQKNTRYFMYLVIFFSNVIVVAAPVLPDFCSQLPYFTRLPVRACP